MGMVSARRLRGTQQPSRGVRHEFKSRSTDYEEAFAALPEPRADDPGRPAPQRAEPRQPDLDLFDSREDLSTALQHLATPHGRACAPSQTLDSAQLQQVAFSAK